MPSRQHEALVSLFRRSPTLAPDLLSEALEVPLPNHAEARIESGDLTDVIPAEYRADLVVVLRTDKPVLGIVVEVQLSVKGEKKYSWPMYVVSLRRRMHCPVLLLVICTTPKVAKWAGEAISLGGDSRIVPLVVAPGNVPEITGPERAMREPQLAVLSAVSHGHDPNVESVMKIVVAAHSACGSLDIDTSTLYFDLITNSLSEEAKRAYPTMLIPGYEYQSAFARQYFDDGRKKGKAEGKAEGRAEGRAEGQSGMLVKLLKMRFGTLPRAVRERISEATPAEVDRMAASFVTATSLKDIVSDHE